MTYNKNKIFYNCSVTHKPWFKKIIWDFRFVYQFIKLLCCNAVWTLTPPFSCFIKHFKTRSIQKPWVLCNVHHWHTTLVNCMTSVKNSIKGVLVSRPYLFYHINYIVKCQTTLHLQVFLVKRQNPLFSIMSFKAFETKSLFNLNINKNPS